MEQSEKQTDWEHRYPHKRERKYLQPGQGLPLPEQAFNPARVHAQGQVSIHQRQIKLLQPLVTKRSVSKQPEVESHTVTNVITIQIIHLIHLNNALPRANSAYKK